MGERLKGRIAIITGGTSGIGEATAEVFVQEGAQVVIAGRSEERGKKIVERLGAHACFKYADVTQEEDISGLIQFTFERYGRIDCLFNNAGGRVEGNLETITMDNFLYGVKLLLGSVVFGMKHVAPIMKKQGSGCIINNSSIAAIRLNQGGYLYSAVKAAVTHITRIAGVELGPYGIRVNSISPGAIATPIFLGGSHVADSLGEEVQERKMGKLVVNLAKATPLPRAGLPRDIAYAAVYLASDEGSFVNCCDLVVDGGRTSLFRE
ncbi:MAG: SDR family oxidoreductase [Syntrophales bacterium]|nr:SDR family oxidoreductase [Syntrophales bacterium]